MHQLTECISRGYGSGHNPARRTHPLGCGDCQTDLTDAAFQFYSMTKAPGNQLFPGAFVCCGEYSV